MEVCKNRNSGKDFIHLEDLPHNRYSLITPSGAIKSLKCDLFEPPDTVADDASPSSITDSQKNMYRIHSKSTEEEPVERLEMWLEELTHQEKQDLRIYLQRQS